MIADYIKLAGISLFPVAIAVLIYLCEKYTLFSNIKYPVKQVLFGVIFGCLAIFGTECGVPFDGGIMNTRDASVLISGLLFGGPSGIIAGLIGGTERFVRDYLFSTGPSYTQLACTISTIFAGFYSALLRKYMFENKKPGTLLSLAIGVVMEIFHMTMVFITNIGTAERAMAVVKTCTLPMVIINSLSVMLATLLITHLSKEKIKAKRHSIRISQTIQRWLLIVVVFAFAVTSLFVYELQDRLADSQSNSILDISISDLATDIENKVDSDMISVARKILDESSQASLKDLAKEYNVSEISFVNTKGIIFESNVDENIGFDMNSGEQPRPFLCLLKDVTEYAQEYGKIARDSSIYRKYAGVKCDGGFIQIGYNAEQFHAIIDSIIKDVTANRHVSKTGYILIFDENFNLISKPTDFMVQNIQSQINKNIFNKDSGKSELTINNEDAICHYKVTNGYLLISVLPESEAMQMRNIALFVNAFMEILVFAILFALIYLLIKKVVVNQIKDINKSLARITQGDLDTVVDVRSNEEFASLSDDINSTVDTLKHYIDEAAARIDKELEFAKNIQASALPNHFPAYPNRKEFDIFASMNPAKEVGGDFYDFYITHNNTLNFLVADVSGKGIPAAMFMMRAKTELKSRTESEQPLNDVFTFGNDALCEGNDAGMFVTAWQGSVNLETGLLRYVCAGHNPPLIKHKDGKFEYLKTKVGFVLAGMQGFPYKIQEYELAQGDIVYLYTDGVTEATDANNVLYGEDRLRNAINSREFDNMQELCKFIKSDVDEFVGDAPQFDDITMLALKYNGLPKAESIHFDNAKIEDIPVLTEFVEGLLEKYDANPKSVIQLSIAIDEIFSNIVYYGYGKNTGPVTVEVIENNGPHSVSLRFIDNGTPYNPLTKEDPDITLSAEERGIGGLGIYMVKKTMDDMRYEYTNDQNILTITKNI